ncbi:MAG TPA: glycosyl hydrolase family 28 protein [Acidobacteriaceae bacterium]
MSSTVQCALGRVGWLGAVVAVGVALGVCSVSAQITKDGVSSQTAALGSQSISFSHTLGAGANRLVVCGVAISTPAAFVAPIVPTMTFAGIRMTAITEAPTAAETNTAKVFSALFYLNDTSLGSTSGTVAVSASLPSAPTGPVAAGCASFFGLAQAGPEVSGAVYSGNATPASNPITATVGDLVVDFFAGGSTSTKSITAPAAPQQSLYAAQLVDTGAGVLATSSWGIVPSTGSISVSWPSEVESRMADTAAAFAAAPTTNYTVTTAVNPVGAGTISLSPSTPGQTSFPNGTVLSVTATPSANFTFTGFTGDLSGTTNPQNLTVNAAKSVTANFAPAQCSLTINTVGTGTAGPTSGMYNCGSTINLSAAPGAGYSFGGWSGGGYTGSNPAGSFTLTANTTETATFIQGSICTLNTSVTGSGSIALNPAGGTYSCGTPVQVTAVPFSGDWTFEGFGGALSGTTNPQTITLNESSPSVSVSAAFTQTSFPINVTIVGPGTVAFSPNATSYTAGTQVQLTATPNSGAYFVGFTGDVVSATSPATTTVNATENVTATFANSVITKDSVSHAVTTTTSSTLSWQHTLGGGASRMVVIEVGSADSVASQDLNAVVSSVLFNGVYATPIPNSLVFGGTSGMVQTQLFYLTEAELPPAGTYTVQVNLAGAIGGFQAGAISLIGVNQGPPEAVVAARDTTGADKIDTPITTLTNNAWVIDVVEDNDLTGLTVDGTAQTIAWTQSSTGIGTGASGTEAVANAGTVTLGWAGSASRLAHSLAAFPPVGTVVPPTYTLTTSVTGGGTVATNPGISQFPTQTGVLLTATPGLGYTFGSWSGDFTSTVNPLPIVMDANHTVTANFVAAPTCTVTYNYVGSGTVLPAAGSYNCGTVLHLTATPSAGYSFASYSGDFSSSDNPADFTLSANSTIVVEFDVIPLCNLTTIATAGGTISPNSGSYACGSTINLQATAGTGYGFSGFTGDYTGTNNPASFQINQDSTITANFVSGASCTLTTNVVGSGTIVPSSGSYACGTTINIQALPAAKYLFSAWSGALSGVVTPTTLTMTANESVTATFVPNTAGVTGDPRTVTEPSYPPVCSTLTALQVVSSPVETSPDTARVQAALNACTAGQAVEFSSSGADNAFIIAPINLPAGVTMLIDPDVTILGSIKYADYACVPADSWCTSLITVGANVDPAPGSGIMGLGVIDGRGGVKLTDKGTSWWGTGSDARPRLIYLGPRSPSASADNFTMYKVTLTNSPKFHVSGLSNNLTIWGIKIYSPPDSPNTDGIDPSGSKNITITNSYISDGDDMIAVKAGVGHVSNVTISNNHMYSGHGISVGSETNAGLNNMYVHDNAIDNGFGGSSVDSIRIKSDVSRGGEVYDVLYKNTCVFHGGDTIVFDPYYASKTGDLIPNFHDITISNFHETYRDSGHKVTMQGYNTPPTVYPLTVTLDNVQFDGATANDFKAPDQTNNAQFTLGPGPVNISSFLIADAAVPANNLTIINNVSNGNPPLDCTNAFVYLAGDLAAPAGAIAAGDSPKVTAVLQNVVAPLVSGSTTTPQQHTPTGTINLLEGSTVVGSGTINGRLASITVPNITAGTHTYTAQYLGDANYTAVFSFGTVTLTASSGVTAPVANAQTVAVGYNSPASITLTATGTGTLTYSIVTQPLHGVLSGTAPAVTYTPNAGYSGADSFTFKANNGVDSNVATVSITVGTPTTTLSLATPSPSTGLTTNQTTLLTATLSPTTAGANTATGTITFNDGGSAICNGVSFNSTTGVATCTTPALTVGSHTFTAVYAGDANFQGSTSNPQTVSVSVPLVTLSVGGFPAADHIGSAHTVTVTAEDGSGTAIAGYTGTVTLGSSDAHATLPAAYTFVASDNGVHTFAVTLNTGGTQTITATSGAVSGMETGIVVDDFVWVLNSTGTLSKMDETGTVILSPVGTAGATATVGGVAFDSSGGIWSVNNGSSLLLHATKTGGSATPITGGGLNLPVGIAIDGSGASWIANTNNTLSVFALDGSVISPATGYQSGTAHDPSALNGPTAIVIDGSGSVWITNKGNGTVTKVFGAATPVVSPTSTAVTNDTLGTRP